MLFEAQHSTRQNYCNIQGIRPIIDFPMHIHQSLEIYAIQSGTARVTIGERVYVLEPNQAVLIFPYQKHEYKTLQPGVKFCCTFSPDFVPELINKNQNLIPENNSFYFQNISFPNATNVFSQKAFLYRICELFLAQSSKFIEGVSMEDDLLSKLLFFVSEHYTENFSLKDVCATIGYNYGYTSRFFKQIMNQSFHEYVNYFRVREAKRLLKDTTDQIQLIASACGFGCMRTFNREFFKTEGQTPTDFRKQFHKS